MNTNIKLKKAKVYKVVQEKLRNKALSKGVNLIAPESIYLSKDTIFGKNVESIFKAFYLNGFYLFISICLFYYSFNKARKKGTLINIGE